MGFELIFVCRSQLEVYSQTCCVFLLMSSREGFCGTCLLVHICVMWSVGVLSLVHAVFCCDVLKAAGKPSLLESHTKYFGCWSGIINCWWVTVSLWNHGVFHIMIVCIFIFQYLCILFYPVHQNENESSETFPWSKALASWHKVLTKCRSTVSLSYTAVNLNKIGNDYDIEACAIKLMVSTNTYHILCIYRPPAGNFTTFLLHLESAITQLYSNTINLIICGDVNVNYLQESRHKSLLIPY